MIETFYKPSIQIGSDEMTLRCNDCDRDFDTLTVVYKKSGDVMAYCNLCKDCYQAFLEQNKEKIV